MAVTVVTPVTSLDNSRFVSVTKRVTQVVTGVTTVTKWDKNHYFIDYYW